MCMWGVGVGLLHVVPWFGIWSTNAIALDYDVCSNFFYYYVVYGLWNVVDYGWDK